MMRDFIRVGINWTRSTDSPSQLLQFIARNANLRIDWISYTNISNTTRFDQILAGNIDTSSDFWVNTQHRLDMNLTFSYPLTDLHLVFSIPEPITSWTSDALAVFRVFSNQLWMVMVIVMSIFVSRIMLTNTVTTWMRLAT